MEQKRVVDKTKFPHGPWMGEPDQLNYSTDDGFDAAIIRHPSMGHLCGYVGVPEGHLLFGKSYDDANRDVDVHGGLTYGGMGNAEVGENPAYWYFGFDCAHCYDLVPSMLKYGPEHDAIYRDIAFVKQHVTRLSTALALAKAAP